MISLVPSWAIYYDEFWDAIKRRNLWFIKLRYGAVLMLFAFLVSSEFILGIKFTNTQSIALVLISSTILIYNGILHWVRKFLKCDPIKFNPLHFSLVQMLLDLTALMLVVYFTGGIETPLSMLFFFHMIIGSLILPGAIIYTIAFSVIFLFFIMVFAEYHFIIPHHAIAGLFQAPMYSNFTFTVLYSAVFGFVMLMSVVLANSIAHQLYRMEQKLVESLDQLNAAEVEKQKYVMSVVHEIKTPLAALHSYLDIVLQGFLGPVNEKILDKLQRVRARSAEAIQLTNDVLKVSKLRLLDEIKKEEIKVRDILSSVLKKQRANIDRKKVKLHFKDNRKVRTKILGDKLLLEIAFSNLVSNALKYIEDEGVVEIILDEKGKGIQLEVCDNGIGIPEKDLEKIFDDFYRASNIKSKGYEGTGMGLSIIKHIVEKHGGTIEVQSPSRLASQNKPGASFIVFLPLES
ncbi:MAG: HAMP domain-containing histidine kinase [Ignavibacteriaceae bacterium]|jgi:signal transduction histidine kinase|nr:HAMP domain-containing histidine kinase [Ignavibacteriaceae bacterium]